MAIEKDNRTCYIGSLSLDSIGHSTKLDNIVDFLVLLNRFKPFAFDKRKSW